MGTHCPFYIWLRQSVPTLDVYPPFDTPHMLACRDTCHDRTQFLHEPCQVIKQTCPCSSMTSCMNVMRISDTMEFAMKGMFLSCPDASKARRTFMNPSDASGILRIGLLLVLCHPSP
jgi:hypothetical protein